MKHDEELVERVAEALYDTYYPSFPGWGEADEGTRGYWSAHARSALDALAPELRHDPPEGCEWVALPTETVGRWADRTTDGRDMAGDTDSVIRACRATVARRPKPEPRTELVPWWEAVGRRHPLGEVLASLRADESDVRFYGPDGSWICDLDGEDDGKVEVLAEDDK